MKKFMLLPLILYFFSFQLNAQYFVSTGDLLQGGVDDGIKLINAYILPANKALMVGVNNADFVRTNYNDKKRINISLRTVFISIPEENLTFDVLDLNLQKIIANDPNNTIAQTIFGDSTEFIILDSKDSTLDFTVIPPAYKPLFSFNTPKGSGLNIAPAAYINLGYKLFYTNVSIGFIPYMKVPKSDANISLLNINIQQDMAMFLKFLRDKPFQFNISAGYYKFYAHADMEIKSDAVVNFSLTPSPAGNYDNQEIKININSLFFAGTFSFNILKNLMIFAGYGYNTGNSRAQILGTYPVYGKDPTGIFSVTLDNITDPMDSKTSYSRAKIYGGAQFDFMKRYYIQASYTLGDYGGLGIALGIRI